jgi:predicted ATPase/DNA-binding winged helix-turn-helix (wHTH) protein
MTYLRTAADDRGTLDSEAGDTVYRFGAFELHVRRQLLLYVGTPCTVPTRALAILTLLLEREGEVATKEELIAAAWRGTFVHEANLKVNVATLRRALNVLDTQHDHISTVPGRGYRLVGPVRREVISTLTFNAAVRRESLPASTSLIGRADEVAPVSSGVLESRFVTVVGAGGIGKTSVAIAAAHRLSGRFAEGVRFVDLAPITDPQYLASAIVAELGVRSDSEDLLGAAIHALNEQPMLLVLDNCEHLLPSLAAVAERLAANLPKASLLVTSREPLRLSREIVFRLEPLSVPAIDTIARDTATALAYSAVELFVIRAAEASGYELTSPDLASVFEICRRLDGLPLALELAASRTVDYTAVELLRLLQDRFDLLARNGDGHPRHRTLRATLEWSYGLLSPIEAAIFRALAVYAGAFTTDDAIIVASAIDLPPSAVLEGVASLISKSLLSADWRRNSLHYRLLESTRAFADDRLGEDRKCDRIRQRHAEHICTSLAACRVGVL